MFDNTLLFYLTDNGGSKAMHANNAPLRGFKQQDYEGGVRVPFIVSWPAQLRGSAKCDVPVWSIDILPLALVTQTSFRQLMIAVMLMLPWSYFVSFSSSA